MRIPKTTAGPQVHTRPSRRPPGSSARARMKRSRDATAPPSDGEPHDQSLTAVASEAMSRGEMNAVSPAGDDHTFGERGRGGGDPDQSVLENDSAGDEARSGSTPAPDQNAVDEIGRAYGVQEEDSGALRSSSELLDRRDHHRAELIPPDKREE
jgi:hypothetical protein